MSDLREVLRALLEEYYALADGRADAEYDVGNRNNVVMAARAALGMPKLPPVYCHFCGRDYDDPAPEFCPDKTREGRRYTCGPFNLAPKEDKQ